MGDREFEDMLRRVMKADLASGTESFRDELLARCLTELGLDPHAVDGSIMERQLSDFDLDLLAAAGDITMQTGFTMGDEHDSDIPDDLR